MVLPEGRVAEAVGSKVTALGNWLLTSHYDVNKLVTAVVAAAPAVISAQR